MTELLDQGAAAIARAYPEADRPLPAAPERAESPLG
jgi:hypothetical protein